MLDRFGSKRKCFRDFVEVELEFIYFPGGSFVLELDLAFVLVFQSFCDEQKSLIDPYDLISHLSGNCFDTKDEEQTENSCHI